MPWPPCCGRLDGFFHITRPERVNESDCHVRISYFPSEVLGNYRNDGGGFGGGFGGDGGGGGGGSCISYTFPGNIRWLERSSDGGGGVDVRSIEPRMRTLFGCEEM